VVGAKTNKCGRERMVMHSLQRASAVPDHRLARAVILPASAGC
jgi:hypothetical protein